MTKIFGECRAMKRTDLLDIKCCGNFEKRLNLFAVFSYDTDEVASCFVIPRLIYIERTEFTETVCGILLLTGSAPDAVCRSVFS